MDKKMHVRLRTTLDGSRKIAGYIARTALGMSLVALREKAICAGMRLLSEEEVLEELKCWRGAAENPKNKNDS
ncbi:MAG: hypothetical protein C4530_20785 [Desulfobacteraceae bacterium]|nr:MAG: hypothetical protein C4530_20785 [Desulfobacteraceae bacterium]